MTEEQFWRANPRIISIWEKAWKMKENRQNELMHLWFGHYGISALTYSIDHCLNGSSKAKSKYIEKPLQLFELTEEEKKVEQEKALNAFIGWADVQKADFDRRHT